MQPSIPSVHIPYWARQTAVARAQLSVIYDLIHEEFPQAYPCIGYQMPAYRSAAKGKIFIYFAAFKRHIGIYPPVKGDDVLLADLANYRGAGGNLSFDLTKPLPQNLIRRVICALHQQYL